MKRPVPYLALARQILDARANSELDVLRDLEEDAPAFLDRVHRWGVWPQLVTDIRFDDEGIFLWSNKRERYVIPAKYFWPMVEGKEHLQQILGPNPFWRHPLILQWIRDDLQRIIRVVAH